MNNEFNNNLENQIPNNNDSNQMQPQNTMGSAEEQSNVFNQVNNGVTSEPVISTPEPASESVQPIQEPVIPQVNPVLEPVQPAPEPVMPQVNPTLEPVQPAPEPVIPQVNPVLEPVQPALQPVQPNISQAPAKKNTGLIVAVIVITTITLILAAIVVILVTNKSSEKTENEYEQGNGVETVTPVSNTTTFMGFEFSEVSGYTYSEDSEYLKIAGNNYAVMLTTIEYSYDTLKLAYETLVSGFKDEGFTVGNKGIKTVSGVEMIYFELTKDQVNAYVAISASPNSNYVYESIAMARDNTFDEKALELVSKITLNSKYVGDYSNYSQSFSVDLDSIK